jgi:mono/diheme cytochrome c family protein
MDVHASALGLALGAIALVAALSLPVAAQQAPAAGKPVSFSASQARQGSLLYRDDCASCHGDRLNGALDAPPLAGQGFMAKFGGKPASELFAFVSTNMPQDRPGALSPKEYAEVVAFVLSKNGVEAGDQDLPSDPDALATMTVLAAPAQ